MQNKQNNKSLKYIAIQMYRITISFIKPIYLKHFSLLWPSYFLDTIYFIINFLMLLLNVDHLNLNLTRRGQKIRFINNMADITIWLPLLTDHLFSNHSKLQQCWKRKITSHSQSCGHCGIITIT